MDEEQLKQLQNSMLRLSRKWTSTSIVITELKEELDAMFAILNNIVVAETVAKAKEKPPETKSDKKENKAKT